MRQTIHRASLVLLIAVLIVASGAGIWHWYYLRWHNPLASQRPKHAILDVGVPQKPFTLLFVGNDISYIRQGKQPVPDGRPFNGRSDALMLLRIDPLSRKVTALQIPRDTLTEIPGYGVQKINAANALGGPQLSKETTSLLTGADIDHYLVLNLNGLVNMVNELGGITLQVPKRMSYMDWTGKLKIDLQPGLHTLTGNQAMGFVRFRHDALGDIGRIERQQIFMRAFTDKMTRPESWAHLPRLLAILHKDVATDLSDLEAVQTLNLIRGLPRENVQISMLPGHFGSSGSWVVDKDALPPLVVNLLNLPADALSPAEPMTELSSPEATDGNFSKN